MDLDTGNSSTMATLPRTFVAKGTAVGPLLAVRRESTRGFGRREPNILDAIADVCGFGSPRSLRAHFLKQIGMSMREFRRVVPRLLNGLSAPPMGLRRAGGGAFQLERARHARPALDRAWRPSRLPHPQRPRPRRRVCLPAARPRSGLRLRPRHRRGDGRWRRGGGGHAFRREAGSSECGAPFAPRAAIW